MRDSNLSKQESAQIVVQSRILLLSACLTQSDFEIHAAICPLPPPPTPPVPDDQACGRTTLSRPDAGRAIFVRIVSQSATY